MDKYFGADVVVDTNKAHTELMTNLETMTINLADKNVDLEIDGAHYVCAECEGANIPLAYGDDWGSCFVFLEPQIIEQTDKGIICEDCAWKKEQK